jgi:hypothetical protein
MSSLDPRIVIKGTAVLVLGVFIAAAALSRDVNHATQRVAATSEVGVVPTQLMIASRTYEQADEGATWSAEPDPEISDRAGLEIWWKNYERKHPAQ